MRPRARLFLLALLTSLMALPQAGQALLGVHGNLVVAPTPAGNTPHVLDGVVFAILPVGDRVYVGGTFTQVREAGSQTALARRGLFAFDAGTGVVDRAFVADFDGGVEALAAAPDGQHIFVAGDFGTLNGAPRRKLAKIDKATAAPAPGFSVSVTSAVNDLVVVGDRVIFGGAFSAVNGAPRGGLAAVSAATGALDPSLDIAFTAPRRGSTPRVRAIGMSPDGATLAVVGNFGLANGLPRFQIALVDVAARPARVVDWRTSRFDDRHTDTSDRDGLWCSTLMESFMREVAFSPDGKYFVVVTTGGYSNEGPLCDSASRWESAERGSDLQPTWVDRTGGDTLTDVTVTDAVVYVGGHQRWLNNLPPPGTRTGGSEGPGAVAREGLAALDPRSGLPLSWNPGRLRGEGVFALVATPQGLWVGSDTDELGGAYHAKLAFLPLAGGSAAPLVTVAGFPADAYAIGGDNLLSRRSFDGQALGAATAVPGTVDWSKVRAAFALGGRLYTAQTDGRLMARSLEGSRFTELGAVNLRGIPTTAFPVAGLTGMAYDNGRLYYTVAGDRRLWYRYFLSEAGVADDVVGTDAFVASGAGDGLDWSGVKGLAVLAGRMFRAERTDLRQILLDAGRLLPATLSLAAGDATAQSRSVFIVPTAASAPPPAPPAPSPPTAPPGGSPIVRAAGASGYWMVGSDGKVYAFGAARHQGAPDKQLGGAGAVDIEPTPNRDGYWIVDTAGRVHPFGRASYYGDTRGRPLASGEQATSLSATASGSGYWIFTDRGRVLAFGDAVRFGDMSAVRLNGPIVDSIRTRSGKGYYMVGSDGGIFAFGDARFQGSMGGRSLNARIESLVPARDGGGYWLVGSDGGVFAFGAPFRGSMGATRLNQPVTGMVPYGQGYLMVAADGGIFNFSDRPFAGSLGASPPSRPVVAVAGIDL